MKILFLHQGGEWLRGSEYSLLTIISGLKNKSYECELWANNDKYLDYAEKLGIQTKKEAFPYIMLDPRELSLRVFSFIRLVFSLIRSIRKGGFDLIYSNGGLPAQAGYFAAKLTNTPIICHVRAPHSYRYIQLFNIGRCDATIFVSNRTRTTHLKKCNIKNPVTIHNGVDPNRTLNFKIEANVPDVPHDFNSIRLCQIGEIVKYKGIDVIISAIEILKQENILPIVYLVGKGVDIDKYKNVIQSKNLQNQIYILGEISNISLFLKKYVDVNLLATVMEESFGRVIVEGYFESKPCIGANIGGIPEVILDGESGFLFEPGDAEQLAEKIKCLHNNKELIDETGRKGKDLANRQFSDKVLVEKVNELIEQTIAHGSNIRAK